ncbi:MAG: glycine cleavage system protein GcvH [Candidatus Saelkia tenebricola]|nr:glycine cleavage system protein GcvH [Candidatus Saelkia tenebricola]
MNVKDNQFYTNEHEWVSIEGSKARIGITDYAQHSLGDITFIELPEIGKKIEQFKQFATVESVKAASDVYAPLTGIVVEVNATLVNQPELLNSSPYEEGWFAVIEIDNIEESNKLMDASAYKKYIEEIAH